MARTTSDKSQGAAAAGYLGSWDEEETRDRLNYVQKIPILRQNPEDSYASKAFSGEGSGASGFDVAVLPDAVKSQVGGLMDTGFTNAASQARMAGQALGYKNATEIAFADAKAAEEAAKKEAAGRRTGGILSTIGKIGGAAIGALALCDQRLKQDVASLGEVEAVDRLSELALQVQAICQHPKRPELEGVVTRVFKLKPVQFRYRPEVDPSGILRGGFLAQQVQDVLPDAVTEVDGFLMLKLGVLEKYAETAEQELQRHET